MENVLPEPGALSCHVIYSSRRDGGLGLPRLNNLYRIAGLKASMGLLRVANVKVQHYVMTERLEEKLMAKTGHLGIAWPPTPAMLDKLKFDLKLAEGERWYNLPPLLVAAQLVKVGYIVASEQTFAVDGDRERLKPDIVASRNGTLRVIDVNVRFENGDALSEAVEEKIGKYNRQIPKLLEVFKCTEGKVLPIIIGTRGAFPASTIRCLEDL